MPQNRRVAMIRLLPEGHSIEVTEFLAAIRRTAIYTGSGRT